MQGHLLQRRLEAGARGGGDLPQVGVQLGVGRVAVLALGAVGLEVRQLHQQFGHMARALAGDRRRQAREVDQGGIVPAARRHGARARAALSGLRGLRHRAAMRQAVQPLRQHRVGLRLAQQRRARRGQCLAHRCRPHSRTARLSARPPGPGRPLDRRQPARVQLRLVDSTASRSRALQGGGGLCGVVERPQQHHAAGPAGAATRVAADGCPAQCRSPPAARHAPAALAWQSERPPRRVVASACACVEATRCSCGMSSGARLPMAWPRSVSCFSSASRRTSSAEYRRWPLGRQRWLGQPVAALPHAQRRHRHAQHACHGAAAVKESDRHLPVAWWGWQ